MSSEFGLISIIMPAYNAKKTINEAINSVLNQSYKNWELIVINDCSTDTTLSIVEKLANKDTRIKLISNNVNSGTSKTRHRGLSEATGEWLAFLDSDDIWQADKLAKQISLQKEIGAELLFTGSAFIDAQGNNLPWILRVPLQIGYKQLLKQNLISNSSVLVRKELFSQFEALGDDMHEDFAGWLRILKTGRIAYGIDEPLLIYRLSVNSKSSNKLKAAIMNWKTYRYVGLNVIEAAYYMIWYSINGLLKYKKLKMYKSNVK